MGLTNPGIGLVNRAFNIVKSPTNITSTLEDTIERLQNSASGGSEIVIPEGVYTCDPITVPRVGATSSCRIKIKGRGRGTQISPSASAQDFIFKLEGAGCAIEDIYFTDATNSIEAWIYFAPSIATQNLELWVKRNRFEFGKRCFLSDGDADNWHFNENNCLAQTTACVDSLNNGLEAKIIENWMVGLGSDDLIAIRFQKGAGTLGTAQQPEGVAIAFNTAKIAGGRALDINTGLRFAFAHNVWGQQKKRSQLVQSANPVSDFTFTDDWFDCRTSDYDPTEGLEPFYASGTIVGLDMVDCKVAGTNNGMLLDLTTGARINLVRTRHGTSGPDATNYALKILGGARGRVTGLRFSQYTDQMHLIEEDTNTLTVEGCNFESGPTKITKSPKSLYRKNFGDDYSPSTGIWKDRRYNGQPDPTDYERGTIEWDTDVWRIGTQNGGTGTGRNMDIGAFGTGGGLRLWAGGAIGYTLNSARHLVPAANVTHDLGNSASLYLRNVYSRGLVLDTAVTAANLADVANAINTTSKFDGRVVLDNTNKRLMVAHGSLATDVWTDVFDGSITITPA